MPIEKPRKDERVSAAYKSSSKPAPKSKVKGKDDTKQKIRVDSKTTGRNKDAAKIAKNESTKSSAHVLKLSESKKPTSSTRSQNKPEVLNSTVKLPKKTSSAPKITKTAELIRKADKSNPPNAKKTETIRKEHKLKDGNLVSNTTVNEIPKITRQDTFELPTVTENVDQQGDDDDDDDDDDTSVSYAQDFEDYESDFEVDEDESDDVGNLVANTDDELDHSDAKREVEEIGGRSATSDLHDTSTGLLEPQVVKEEYRPVVAEIKPKRPTTASFQNFMNFAEAEKAQKRKQVFDKIRNRGIKLLQLLTLDTMNFNLFEMKPVKYSIFMLAFGGTNKVQVSCQTELDGSEAETQTDEIKVLEKWSQHPADCTNACGGQSLDDDNGKIKQLESGRLLKVLRIVSKTVEILLDEEVMRYSSGQNSQGSQSNLEVCSSILRLTPPDFMKSSCVTWIHSDGSNPFVILSAHKALPEPLVGHGAVCVWDLLQPIKPKRILICASCPTRCCLSSHTLTAVVAGNVDGSLVMWDLKDTGTDYNVACSDVPLYCPTYSTAGINGHQSPIVSVKCLAAKHNRAEGKHNDGPTQIASLDEFAVFIVWVFVEARGSDDVRLAPGGHLILVPSATVELNSLINTSANMRVFGFEVHPKERNNIFVATDLGVVVNFKLNGCKVKQYKHSPDVPVEVTAVSVLGSDQRRMCFLAGCNDGTVRLHAADSEKPIISWAKAANGAPIKTVMWSSSGPNIFFILDTLGEMHVWDLTYSDVHPCSSSDSKIARYECAVIGSDPRGLGKEKRNFDPYLALGTSEGIVEVHYLKENYSRCGKEEVDLFNFYLDIL